jgi:hypothetical protein
MIRSEEELMQETETAAATATMQPKALLSEFPKKIGSFLIDK